MPVFDEVVYITDAYNMARLTPTPLQPQFLGHPIAVTGAVYNFTQIYGSYSLGQDFNIEHPPLAKAIMALSVRIFSPNVVSYFWLRVPSVIMSVAALIGLYGIALLFVEKKYATLATLILSFDILFWVHSRFALLDIYMLGFMLVGMWLMLKAYMNPKHHHRIYMACAVVFFTLATMSKITGIIGFFVVALYLLIENCNWKTLKNLSLQFIVLGATTLIVYTVLLQFFGLRHNPIDQLNLMRYGLFARQNWKLVLILGVAPISQPWDWLFNEKAIHYAYIYDPSTAMPMVDIWGRINPAIIFASIPVLVFAAYLMIGKRDKLSTLGFIWFMAMWLPYIIPTWLGQEQFLHHMLAAIFPLVLMITDWLRAQNKWFIAGYIGFVIGAWLWYYPYPFLWFYIFGAAPYPLPPLGFFG
jgi:predicted membrane-bound dolichyl-phosphate-mannose-protein mannosyltransferase